MSLTNYWYPTDLASLFEHFDSISQSKSRNNSNYHHTLNVPKMDLVEQDQAHTLVVELPGYKKDAINIALENNRLTISGEADKTSEYEQGKLKVSERSFGHFSRSISVPPGVKSSDVKAEMTDGLLKVSIPKQVTQPETAKIAIA